MIFLSLMAVLAIVNFTSFAATIQKDAWFVSWVNQLRALPAVSTAPLLPMILALAIPLVLLVVCMLAVLHYASAPYLFFIYVPVLLYSLGRGDFVVDVNTYIAAAMRGDTVAASKWVADCYATQGLAWEGAEVSNWQALHTQALKIFAYRSFEHTFAVLFWFVIAGPLGALLYRLSIIYRAQTVPYSAAAILADKWLWLIELPAVRLMGLIWAFVGNFDSRLWNESLLDTHSSSITLLNNSLRGALSVPADAYREAYTAATAQPDTGPTPEVLAEESSAVERENEAAQDVIEDLVGINLSPQHEPAYSFALVKSSVPLYSRSLLFCLGVIAFATLFL